jgi:hypothetical protein
MPFKSDQQRKLFYAAAAGKSDKISPKVAKSFIQDANQSSGEKDEDVLQKPKKAPRWTKLKTYITESK